MDAVMDAIEEHLQEIFGWDEASAADHVILDLSSEEAVTADIMVQMNSLTNQMEDEATIRKLCALNTRMLHDETDNTCHHAEKFAREVIQHIRPSDLVKSKEELLPLQGTELWQKWGQLDKKQSRSFNPRSLGFKF